MEAVVGRLGVWALVLLAAIFAIAGAQDSGFAIHMGIVAGVAALILVLNLTRFDPLAKVHTFFKMPLNDTRYDDDVVRWGV